jgi:hypothetical protein
MAHTPGPWSIAPPFSGFSKITGCDGKLIFGLAAGSVDEKRSDDECDANACLIAAAPALFEALKAMVDAEVDYMMINNLGDPEQQHNVKRARAAIAKAEGA